MLKSYEVRPGISLAVDRVQGTTKTWALTEQTPVHFEDGNCRWTVCLAPGFQFEWSGPRGTWWLFDPNEPAMVEISFDHDVSLAVLGPKKAAHRFRRKYVERVHDWRRRLAWPVFAAVYSVTVYGPPVRRVFSWLKG